MEAPKQPAIEFITAEALAELTADQNQLTATHLILDVRTAEEYATGHIPSAINIDYRDISAQIKARSETLQAFKTKKVVVYCERGVRAGRAEAALTAAGFQVIRLKGDIRAWKAAGLPIQR
ncbi:MAG: rhodanese-like domain-containing protein [Cyanobacteria bacterium J06560_2]